MKRIFLVSSFLAVALNYAALDRCWAGDATPAPSSYTSQNYSLRFSLPPGLFRCGTPPAFVGSEHGFEAYLVKPTECSSSEASAMGVDAGSIPRISVFYEYNIVPMSVGKNSPEIPRTNEELLYFSCQKNGKVTGPSVSFLGAKAEGCLSKNGNLRTLTYQAVYNQSAPQPNAPPDSKITISLDTTKDRYKEDKRILLELVKGVSACRSFGPAYLNRPACAKQIPW